MSNATTLKRYHMHNQGHSHPTIASVMVWLCTCLERCKYASGGNFLGRGQHSLHECGVVCHNIILVLIAIVW